VGSHKEGSNVVVVSYSGKEINAKLVYYGAGLSGKTTNLESIYEAVPDTSRGKMVSMKTQSDRTLFFDLLPLDLGEIMGFKTRFLLYTVPGQVFYNATRKLVLKGADGVIFVADSQRAMVDANLESLANLRDNFAEQGINLAEFPMVIQYNKRDLPDILSVEELNAVMNPRKVPYYEAVAKTGDGVLKTFTAVSKLVLQDMQKFPDRHNFTLSDILGSGAEKKAEPVADIMQEMPPAEPSMPGAPMAEAKPEMAALEEAVEAGIKVNLGKAAVVDGQIILPFGLMSSGREDNYQLRIAIDMEAPAAKRFKIMVKSFKK
jgi:mutual gliding-motility protein MglA